MLLAPIAIPIGLVVALALRVGLLKGTAELTTEDVEGYIGDFLDGGGGPWDWDDFTCIPITDRSLDRIREEAMFVQLPLTDEGEATLRRLLERVRAM